MLPNFSLCSYASLSPLPCTHFSTICHENLRLCAPVHVPDHCRHVRTQYTINGEIHTKKHGDKKTIWLPGQGTGFYSVCNLRHKQHYSAMFQIYTLDVQTHWSKTRRGGGAPVFGIFGGWEFLYMWEKQYWFSIENLVCFGIVFIEK